MRKVPVSFIHWFVGKKAGGTAVVCFVCRHVQSDELVIFNKLVSVPLDAGNLLTSCGDYIWTATNGHSVHLLRLVVFRSLLEEWKFQFPSSFRQSLIARVDEESGLLENFIIRDSQTASPITLKVTCRLSKEVGFNQRAVLDHGRLLSNCRHTGDVVMSWLKSRAPGLSMCEFPDARLGSVRDVSWPSSDPLVKEMHESDEMFLMPDIDCIILDLARDAWDYDSGPSAFFTFCRRILKWKLVSYKGPEMRLIDERCFESESIFVNSCQMVSCSESQLEERLTLTRYFMGQWTPNSYCILARALTATDLGAEVPLRCKSVDVDVDDDDDDGSIKKTLLGLYPDISHGGYFYCKYNNRVLSDVCLSKYDFSNFLPRVLLKVLPPTSFLFEFLSHFLHLVQAAPAGVRKSLKRCMNTICGYLKHANVVLFEAMNAKARSIMLNAMSSIEKSSSLTVCLVAFDGFILRGARGDCSVIPGEIEGIPLKFEGSFTDGLFKTVNETILIDRRRRSSAGKYQLEVRGICQEDTHSKTVRQVSLGLLYNLCAKLLNFEESAGKMDWRGYSLEDYVFRKARTPLLAISLLDFGLSIRSCYRDKFVYGAHNGNCGELCEHWSEVYQDEVSNKTIFLTGENVGLDFPHYAVLALRNVSAFKEFFPVSFDEICSEVKKKAAFESQRKRYSRYRLRSHPLEIYESGERVATRLKDLLEARARE